ncbi:hypothetical protein HQ590_06465 [bacterium]|nr:hypothetical protein [bacterium]
MIRDLKLKPDFGKTIDRFEAWWHAEMIDRPPVTLWLGPNRVYDGPTSQHARLRDRWLDVEFAVDSAVARFEQEDFVADTFPVFWPNMGPEITATLYGCDLKFGEDTTWSTPVVHQPADWARILDCQPDFENFYWQRVEALTDYALAKCDGRYVVGFSDLHGSYDILAALRDPQALCTDLLDCPYVVAQAGLHVARGYVEAFQRCWAKLSAAGFGSSTWCPVYHQGPAYVGSCDFWCMVSPQMARELILPTLLIEGQCLKRNLFHLDGPNALQHLDLVLALPQINALQWVFGAGNGPAARWLDVYRRALQAGKGVQVLADNPQDALTVLDALGPRGVWVTVTGGVGSPEAARALLQEVERRSCRGVVSVPTPARRTRPSPAIRPEANPATADGRVRSKRKPRGR